MIVDQHDDMFLTSHTGEIFFVQNGSLNATMIGDISQIDGFSSPTTSRVQRYSQKWLTELTCTIRVKISTS